MNFLFGPLSDIYDLSSDEKLLLIALSKHKGNKGIYPSAFTLSKEVKRTDRNVRNTLKRLENKGLIKITAKAGHSNHYDIVMPTEKLSTTPVADDRPVVHDTPVADDIPPLSSTTVTPVVHDRQYNTDNQYRRNNTERAPPSVAPLSLVDNFFKPEQSNIELAKDLGVNLERELESFRDKHEGRKTQEQFKHWLIKAHEYGKSRKPMAAVNEQKCTIPFWGPGHPTWDSLNKPRVQ